MEQKKNLKSEGAVNQCKEMVLYKKPAKETSDDDDDDDHHSENRRHYTPRSRDYNITGSDYVHFGNTYVSYGIYNVPAGMKRSDFYQPNVFNASYINGKTSGFRIPITINNEPITNLKPGRLDLTNSRQVISRKDKRILITFMVILFMLLSSVLIIIILTDRNTKKVSNAPYEFENFDVRPAEPFSPSTRFYGLTFKHCEEIGNKSSSEKPPKKRVRFVVKNSLLVYCTYFSRKDCSGEFLKETKNHVDNGLKDIYYNYIIDSTGKVHEGRHVTECDFDEPILPADHSSLITVGIGYCFDDIKTGYKKTSAESKAIKELIDYLQNYKKFLDKDDYSLEFLNECRNSRLLSALPFELKYRASFYDHSSYYDGKIPTDKRENENNGSSKTFSTDGKKLQDLIYLPNGSTPYLPIDKTKRIDARIIDVTVNIRTKFLDNYNCSSLLRSDEINKIKNKYNFEYIFFADGSYCKNEKSKDDNIITIVFTDECCRINSFRSYTEDLKYTEMYVKSVFKLAKEINSLYSEFHISFYMCPSESKNKDFIALVFNANEHADVIEKNGYILRYNNMQCPVRHYGYDGYGQLHNNRQAIGQRNYDEFYPFISYGNRRNPYQYLQ